MGMVEHAGGALRDELTGKVTADAKQNSRRVFHVAAMLPIGTSRLARSCYYLAWELGGRSCRMTRHPMIQPRSRSQ